MDFILEYERIGMKKLVLFLTDVKKNVKHLEVGLLTFALFLCTKIFDLNKHLHTIRRLDLKDAPLCRKVDS
jgi:hypothetical protein